MTITIAFDGSGFRTFKEFYKLQVLPHWGCAFPHLVSYTRFVELMPWSLMGLCSFLNTCSCELMQVQPLVGAIHGEIASYLIFIPKTERGGSRSNLLVPS